MNTGNYRAVVSFIGLKSDTSEVFAITSDHNHYALGEIGIVPLAVEIDDEEVRGTLSTTTRKIDRQTYRAADFETAKGGTAVDVLNKLPSVSVGPDGDVLVPGTTEFMVYLNGKPTQMEASVLLNQIAANSIENIEVITVPTARFDAQGKGGIVNITTKKSGSDGLSISASGMAGGAPWGNITDKYSGYEMNDNRVSTGINLVYRKKSTSLYGGFNLNNRNINGSRTGDARLLQTDGSYYHMVASGERPEWFKNTSDNAPLIGYRLTIDYDKNFDNGYKLGLGFQPSLVKQEGAFRYDTLNVSSGLWGSYDQLNNDIDLSCAIYAAFADYSAQWGKLNALAGLRLEYMD